MHVKTKLLHRVNMREQLICPRLHPGDSKRLFSFPVAWPSVLRLPANQLAWSPRAGNHRLGCLSFSAASAPPRSAQVPHATATWAACPAAVSKPTTYSKEDAVSGKLSGILWERAHAKNRYICLGNSIFVFSALSFVRQPNWRFKATLNTCQRFGHAKLARLNLSVRLRKTHMRHTALLLLLIFQLLPSVSHAQSVAEQQGMLYLQSVAFPKRASACSARLLGYMEKFSPLFAKWSTLNQSRLLAGETFLRAEATKENKDFDFHVQAVTTIDAQLMEKSKPEILKENCDAMLERLASGA